MIGLPSSIYAGTSRPTVLPAQQVRLLLSPPLVRRENSGHRNALDVAFEPVLHSRAPLEEVWGVPVRFKCDLVRVDLVKVKAIGVRVVLQYVEPEAARLVPDRTLGIAQAVL